MTRTRSAILPFFVLATATFGSGLALAEPAAQPARQRTLPLTFSVQARIAATGMTKGPAQNIRAEVALSGAKARVQTINAGKPVVVLYTPPYVYRLLPYSKAGVRWQLKTGTKSSLDAFDPQALLRDPTQVRRALLQGGAKRSGVAQLKGTPTEIYELKPVGQRVQSMKVWLRRADALPVRLEAKGQGVEIVVTWSSYARPRSLAAVLFAPPINYKIRDVRSAPPLAGL